MLTIFDLKHSQAPDIAGQGIANPVGTILSAALLLRYSLHQPEEAQAIEDAVRKVLDAKDIGGYEMRTKDLKGNATSKQIGDKVLEVLESLL